MLSTIHYHEKNCWISHVSFLCILSGSSKLTLLMKDVWCQGSLSYSPDSVSQAGPAPGRPHLVFWCLDSSHRQLFVLGLPPLPRPHRFSFCPFTQFGFLALPAQAPFGFVLTFPSPLVSFTFSFTSGHHLEEGAEWTQLLHISKLC